MLSTELGGYKKTSQVLANFWKHLYDFDNQLFRLYVFPLISIQNMGILTFLANCGLLVNPSRFKGNRYKALGYHKTFMLTDKIWRHG